MLRSSAIIVTLPMKLSLKPSILPIVRSLLPCATHSRNWSAVGIVLVKTAPLGLDWLGHTVALMFGHTPAVSGLG